MELNEILLYWFLYIASGAAVGSLVGTLVALGIRGLYRKLKNWTEK